MKRIGQRHFEAGIQEAIAGKRVMQQSLFAAGALVPREVSLAAGAIASPRMAYALGGAALLVALVALAVALLK